MMGIQLPRTSILVGEIEPPQIEEYVNIVDLVNTESMNVSSSVDVTIQIEYSYVNVTEVSINVRDSDSNIVIEDFDSLEGQGASGYNLTFDAPDEGGTYSYTVNIEENTA